MPQQETCDEDMLVLDISLSQYSVQAIDKRAK